MKTGYQIYTPEIPKCNPVKSSCCDFKGLLKSFKFVSLRNQRVPEDQRVPEVSKSTNKCHAWQALPCYNTYFLLQQHCFSNMG